MSQTRYKSQFPALHKLLNSNHQWATDVDSHEPGFFSKLAQGQSPSVLWIGCADSRVPESVIMACRPGEIFVHRNIANQFHLEDDNAQSVLTYAVETLGVEHVVVVGHTQCGGALACFSAGLATSSTPTTLTPTTPLSRWLTPMTNLASSLHVAHGSGATVGMLVEENVKMQVGNLCKTEVVQNAWKAAKEKGKQVWVHGWVYEIEHGTLKDLGISRGAE